MTLRIPASVLAFASAAACLAAPLLAQAPDTRTIFVSVLDGHKAPVTGLTASELALKEGGKAREIVSVETAAVPPQIAIVIDDDDQGGRALQEGLEAFAKKLGGKADVALVTTRGGPNLRLPFTREAATVLEAIDALPLVNPGLAYLPAGMLNVASSWTRQPVARPVVIGIASPGMTVASTEDGPDGPVPSTRTVGATVDPASPSNAAVQDALRRSHALFYLIHLDTYQARSVDNSPPTVHYSWPLDAPAQSGGRTERVVSVQGVTVVLERLADELMGQYAVTYRSPDAPANVTIDLDVKRKGLTVRAPQRWY